MTHLNMAAKKKVSKENYHGTQPPKDPLFWIAILAILTIAVYFIIAGLGRYKKTKNTNTTPTVSALLTVEEVGTSGVSGTALLEENNGMVRVMLRTGGFEEGVPQPAHIHAGSCDELGDIVFPLSNVVDGSSTTTLETSLVELTAASHVINIHESADNAKVSVACVPVTL